MVKNKSVIFNSIPDGYPVPGKDLIVTESEFDLSAVPEGGIITRNLYCSLDPYQRGRMRDANIKSYVGAYPLGSVITNAGVTEVLKSNAPGLKEGDLITGHIGLENYSAIPKEDVGGFTKLHNEYNLPLSNFIGVLGMPGLTAYSSLYKIGKPKKGETIFISAASGAVGQLVGQLAKREGLIVIGSVGSDKKVEFVKNELKFDEAFNYKTTSNAEALKRLAPQGIDIYYENVGGEALEAALGAANTYARIIVCGMISQYNVKSNKDIYLPTNLMEILTKRLTVQGFIVSDAEYGPAYRLEHQTNVREWLTTSEVIALESITDGVENAPDGLVGMLRGENFGKALVRIIHE